MLVFASMVKYSVTADSKLETQQQPLSAPEIVTHKLSGGYDFTKISLAERN